MPTEECAVAFDSGVEFIEIGIIDDADGRDLVDHETEGDAVGREVMHEVCRSVDGVDDECWRRGEDGDAWFVGFFADEGECWVGRHEAC